MLLWRITRKPFLTQALAGLGAKKYGGAGIQKAWPWFTLRRAWSWRCSKRWFTWTSTCCRTMCIRSVLSWMTNSSCHSRWQSGWLQKRCSGICGHGRKLAPQAATLPAPHGYTPRTDYPVTPWVRSKSAEDQSPPGRRASGSPSGCNRLERIMGTDHYTSYTHW